MEKPDSTYKLVTIAVYTDAMLANLMRSKLEAYGIQSFLDDENIVTVNPLYAHAVGGMKLKVREEQAEEASLLLDEEHNPAVLEEEKGEEPACPFCSSHNVELRSNHPNLLVAAGSLFMSSLPLNKKVRYYCKGCGKWFTKPSI